MKHSERPLTAADKEHAFRRATSALVKWYGEQIKVGMTDDELAEALQTALGIFGGSCRPGELDVVHQGAGLKIWAGWHVVNHVVEKPLFQGKHTIAMAREIYGIQDPENHQMPLL